MGLKFVCTGSDCRVVGSNAFQVDCLQSLDGGGWTKVVQYLDGPYTPTAAAYGSIATTDVQDGKLSDTNIDLIGGARTLLNTGTVTVVTPQFVFTLTDATDSLDLSTVSGRYVGLGIVIDKQSRIITGYDTSGTNPKVTVSLPFTSLVSGKTYQIYTPGKEWRIRSLTFTGTTNAGEEPIYTLFIRSTSKYSDTAFGQVDPTS
eukprot:1824630-Rhodomonas_salina.3